MTAECQRLTFLGAIACFSYAGIAAIDPAPPAVRLQIYAKMYHLGKGLMPLLAGSSSLVLFVLAGSCTSCRRRESTV